MFSQVFIIGKLIEVSEAENTLTIQSETENSEETLIRVTLWGDMLSVISERYSPGVMVAVKGSLKTEDGVLRILAARISFITQAEENGAD